MPPAVSILLTTSPVIRLRIKVAVSDESTPVIQTASVPPVVRLIELLSIVPRSTDAVSAITEMPRATPLSRVLFSIRPIVTLPVSMASIVIASTPAPVIELFEIEESVIDPVPNEPPSTEIDNWLPVLFINVGLPDASSTNMLSR